MLSLLLRIWQDLMKLVGRSSAIEKRLAELVAGQQRIELARLEDHSLLVRILDNLEPGPAVRFIFTAELEDGQILHEVTMLEMRADQKVKLSITPLDKRGNPAALDGVPEWGTANSELVTLEVAADGLSATAFAVGPLGSTVASVQADGDLGEGVTPLAGELEIRVVSGAAVTLKIEAGTPEDQEAPPLTGRRRKSE